MSTNKHIEDELLINYLLGECSAEEKVLIEKWLAESEQHRAHYKQFEFVWVQSKNIIREVVVDENQAWQRLQARMKEQDLVHLKVTRTTRFSGRKVALLVGAIVLLLQAFWFFNTNEKSKPTIVKNPKQEINIIQSAQKGLIDTLNDKSIVTLNKNTALEVPKQFVGNERRVSLKGEAFFAISHNKEKPFIIETQNDVLIKVIGTSFNVKSYPDYTEVIVETGVVELNNNGEVVRLRANQKAKIYKKDKSITVEKSTDKLYQYYRSKTFECDGTPLWKVVEVLNEAYEEKVIISNRDLRDMALTTQFDNEPLDMVMEILSETFEFEVEKRNNTYFIK